MQNNLMTPSLVDRLKGVITFKAPVYKAIAEDPTADQPALMIVIASAVINALLSTIFRTGQGGLIGAIIASLLTVVIGWLFGSWLTAFVAKKFFNGDTNTAEMKRVLGHTFIFQIIPVIGGFLAIVGNVIGIREAAGFDTTKAILTAIISGVIAIVIAGIIFAIVAIPMLALGAAR